MATAARSRAVGSAGDMPAPNSRTTMASIAAATSTSSSGNVGRRKRSERPVVEHDVGQKQARLTTNRASSEVVSEPGSSDRRQSASRIAGVCVPHSHVAYRVRFGPTCDEREQTPRTSHIPTPTAIRRTTAGSPRPRDTLARTRAHRPPPIEAALMPRTLGAQQQEESDHDSRAAPGSAASGSAPLVAMPARAA